MTDQEQIYEYCSLCEEPLDADNCYGTNDFPLCKYHHEKYTRSLYFLLSCEKTGEAQMQLRLEI